MAGVNNGGAKKKVFWKFDETTSTLSVDTTTSVNAEIEAAFSFELEIYKDSETHVESLKITNYKSGVGNKNRVENGSIVTSIMDLGTDIKNFKRFGVVIGDTYFRDLARRIEDEYSKIRIGTVSLQNGDTRYSILIEQVKEFLAESKGDYITSVFCYIPVNMFNDLASDCGYSDYEMKTLRGQLSQDKYIHVVPGRYAILKRLKDKPERVIAFYREKLDIEAPKKQTEKSSSDE